MTNEEKLLCELNLEEYFSILSLDVLQYFHEIQSSNNLNNKEILALFGYCLRRNPRAYIQLLNVFKRDMDEEIIEILLMRCYDIYEDPEFLKYSNEYIRTASFIPVNTKCCSYIFVQHLFNDMEKEVFWLAYNAANTDFIMDKRISLDIRVWLAYVDSILKL